MQRFAGEQALHGLKKFALFLANMFAQHRGENLQIGDRELAGARALDVAANESVLDTELIDELLEVLERIGGREDVLFLGEEVMTDFVVEEANDLGFPAVHVGCVVDFGEGFSDTDTKREGVLMLMRERNEARIAQHVGIMRDDSWNT